MLKYAENIKKIRKQKNYTQSELADGIASQGMISKIEKKQLSPDIELLEAIADKLDCSLMDLLSNSDESEINQIYSYIDNLIKRREYAILEEFVRNNPMTETIRNENEAYYRWINAIIISQTEEKFKVGIEEMQQALDMSTDDQLSIRILVGLSVLYSQIEQYETSIQCLIEASTLSENVEIEMELKQNINFQIARMYSVVEQFGKSIFYNRIAIEFAVEQESLFLLDDLHLLLADSYLRTNQFVEAKSNIGLAQAVAEIKSNAKLLPYIEHTRQQIDEKLN